jgi:hypothetical protein
MFIGHRKAIIRKNYFSLTRRDARVAEWDGLENRCAGNCTEGSNPSLSANNFTIAKKS